MYEVTSIDHEEPNITWQEREGEAEESGSDTD